MTTLWIAIALAGACAGLFKGAFYFTIDASPVGSMMLLASAVSGLASVFLFGVATGAMLS